MKSAQAMPDDNADGNDITLDMTNPDIADQFSTCEPGETLTVKSKDDTSLVLTKGEGNGDAESGSEDAGEGGEEPKWPVALLMAKKMKR